MRALTLNKQDTCFTYVIKRKGIESFLNIDDGKLYNLSIEKHLDNYFNKQEFNYRDLQIGDVIMWENTNTHYLPISIDGNCSVHYKKVLSGLHLAIVERIDFSDNNNETFLISEVLRGTSKVGIPSINVRNIDFHTESLPKYILKPINQK